MVVQNIAEEQVLGSDGIRYDAAKFGWIGRLASNLEIAYLWHTVPVDGIDDLKRRETIFAGSGSSSIIYPLLLNNILGTRIKLVRGYSGTPTAHLAMERGEAEGTLGSLSGIRALVPEWLATGKIKVLLQFRQARHADLANVPTIMEVMPTEADKQLFGFFISSATVGRSLLAPPGLTPARVAALRAGFDATAHDPQFQADAAQAHIELEPLAGAAIQDTVERQVGVASSIRERILAVRWRQ
jgi:tripartite-type tricarboxylate transporter receptor subunit TctC